MDISLFGVPIAALVVGLVEMIKQTTGLPSRFASLVALVLSIAFTVLGYYVGGAFESAFEAIVLGIMIGLSACGLYSGGKALVEAGKDGQR